LPLFTFALTVFRSRTCSHPRLRVSASHAFLNSSDNYSWAGFVLSRQLDKKKFQPVVVSPRTYFVFTPLLASTAVGTLEFRTTLESVRARSAGVEFFQGWADDVNFNEKRVLIEDATVRRPLQLSGKAFHAASLAEADQSQRSRKKGQVFDLNYDKLVIAVGCYSQTFGTPGVKENAFFLKDVVDARKIRKRILECELFSSI
jgi:NADH dehydrogenase